LNCITHLLSLFFNKELKAETMKLRENDSNRTGRKNRGEPLTRFLNCMRGRESEFRDIRLSPEE
jgi:hypothetical protein